jgi:hypothetical protein
VIFKNFSTFTDEERMAVLKTARLMERLLEIPEPK